MEDAKLISLYWDRSEAAIEGTRQKYGGLCRSLIANILTNREDIDECLNDTYLGVWNAVPPEKPVSLAAFICRTARNLALKKYEYLSAKKRSSYVSVSLDEIAECFPENGDLLGEDTGEITAALNAFLRTLERETRNVFLRRYWYFDSIGDIAKRFHMSSSKVTSMLFRTRNKLKDFLTKEGIDL